MDMLSIHSTPLDTALNVYPHVFTEWMDMKSTTFILYRARHECVQWVSIITHKFMKQENLRRSHIFINGFSLCFFLACFLLSTEELGMFNIEFWCESKLRWHPDKIHDLTLGKRIGKNDALSFIHKKGSVNCRQNFNVKNNILLEANLFFIDWNSNELWRAMDQDVTVGWHVRSHCVCFYLIAFQFVHIFLVVCWFLQRVFEIFFNTISTQYSASSYRVATIASSATKKKLYWKYIRNDRNILHDNVEFYCW